METRCVFDNSCFGRRYDACNIKFAANTQDSYDICTKDTPIMTDKTVLVVESVNILV